MCGSESIICCNAEKSVAFKQQGDKSPLKRNSLFTDMLVQLCEQMLHFLTHHFKNGSLMWKWGHIETKEKGASHFSGEAELPPCWLATVESRGPGRGGSHTEYDERCF